MQNKIRIIKKIDSLIEDLEMLDSSDLTTESLVLLKYVSDRFRRTVV